MQPQQQYLQQHQQQQYQVPSMLPHHAVTTCGPTALGIGLPAFGGSAPAEQMLQSPQQALSVPAADVCFSSVGSAAAAAAAGTAAAAGRGGGTEMRSKSRSSSGKRSAQISAVTGMPLTKSGDASRRYRWAKRRRMCACMVVVLAGWLSIDAACRMQQRHACGTGVGCMGLACSEVAHGNVLQARQYAWFCLPGYRNMQGFLLAHRGSAGTHMGPPGHWHCTCVKLCEPPLAGAYVALSHPCCAESCMVSMHMSHRWLHASYTA
jgi:hypothetical protein